MSKSSMKKMNTSASSRPTGVYVYIKKEFVTPLHAVAVKSPDQDGTSTPPAIVQNRRSIIRQPDVAGTTTTQPSVAGLPSTQPAVALVPSTQPDAASAQADFDKLEGEFATQAAQPLENQKPAELAAGYDKVAKGGLLPDSMRKIAEYKAAMLKVHADDQTQYLAVKKEQDEAKARMASLRAEREETGSAGKKHGDQIVRRRRYASSEQFAAGSIDAVPPDRSRDRPHGTLRSQQRPEDRLDGESVCRR